MTGTTYNVSSTSELYAALAQAGAGDTVLLAGGDYGDFTLNGKSGFNVAFDGNVTIRSADQNAPASFSSMHLYGAQNVTFDNVVFDYTFTDGDRHYSRYFDIKHSANIAIVNSVFDGDLARNSGPDADGYGQSIALSVQDSSGITLDGTEFFDFLRGAVFERSSDLTVTDNTVHSMSSDGFNFIAVQNVVIEGNSFRDFEKPESSSAHKDMIQFWTNGTDTPSTDIVIRGNSFDAGGGQATQSIFMRNEMVDSYGAGEEMFYRNVLIEDNVIRNGHLHGITVGEADGLIVRNNTLVAIDADNPQFIHAPSINIAESSKNVSVSANISRDVTGFSGQEDWQVWSNAIVQNTDKTADNHYRNVFVESSITAGQVTDLTLAPGTEAATLGAGAPATVLDTAPAAVTPLFDVAAGAEDGVLVLDASYTYGPSGPIGEAEARFVWTFEDGTTAEGLVVQRAFDQAGSHTVTLTVETPEGGSYVTDTTLDIPGADVLSYDQARGSFIAQGYGQEDVVNAKGAAAASLDTGVKLGGSGSSLELSKESIQNYFGSQAYTLSMTLQATGAPGQSHGEVVRQHGGFIVSVAQSGDVHVQVATNLGAITQLKSVGLKVNDGAAHDIEVRFDGPAGKVALAVDGSDVAVAEVVDGTAPELGSWGLVFGNPWGKQNFEGVITALDLDAKSPSYPAYTGSARPVEIDTAPAQPAAAAVEEPAPQPSESSAGAGAPTPAELATVLSLEPLSLGGSGVQHSVGRETMTGLYETEQYVLSMQLQADSPGVSQGEVVRLHQNFILSVQSDGDLVATVFNNAGDRVNLVTEGVSLNDGAAHAVELVFDAQTDTVTLTVDGAVAAQATGVDGVAPEQGIWDMTFGNPWGKQNFDGTVSDFQLQAVTNEEASLTAPSDRTPVVLETQALEMDMALRDVVAFNADDGLFYVPQGEDVAALEGSDATSFATSSGAMAKDLGRTDDQLQIARDFFSETFDATAMELSLTFKADQPGESAGEVARIHNAFILSAQDDGDVVFQFFNDEGRQYQLISDGVTVNDGALHEIDIRFDGELDTLQMLVDNAVVAEASGVEGEIAVAGHRNLSFGNPWGNKQSFDGTLTEFDLNATPEFDIALGSGPTQDDLFIV